MCYTTVYRGINSLTLTYTTRDSCITYISISRSSTGQAHMYVADALSRPYLPYEPSSRDLELSADIDVRIHSLLYELPASNRKIDKFRSETAACP